MTTHVMSKTERRKAVSMNRTTNFIAADGFEAPPKPTFETGTIPSKGEADRSQVGAMIDNLRREHFHFGLQQPMKTRASDTIGMGATSSKHQGKAPWAHLRTNYSLGVDKPGNMTDYQSRFQKSGGF